MIDKTLYNIRRERRCEFIAEGMRKDDLLRWRSLDKNEKLSNRRIQLARVSKKSLTM
mgnify:FL=1